MCTSKRSFDAKIIIIESNTPSKLNETPVSRRSRLSSAYAMGVFLTMRGVLCAVCWLLIPSHVVAFSVSHLALRPCSSVSLAAKRRVLVKKKTETFAQGRNVDDEKVQPVYDPLGIASAEGCLDLLDNASTTTRRAALSFSAAAVPLTTLASSAIAVSSRDLLSAGNLNPANFNPVCPASDAFYRGLQGSTQAIVGDEAFVEYGPLIAGGLLRIRLELCVVESFFNEAVGPFIEKNGLSWILPIHETVETFLAGVVFSLASTFILVGSTKIVSVIITYVDLFLGLPSRVFGGFFFDRARGKPVTLDVGFGSFKKRVIGPEEPVEGETVAMKQEDKGPVAFLVIFASGAVKYFGEISGVVREVAEGIDLFVGRYLTFFATLYIALKFLHFKVFPDFP